MQKIQHYKSSFSAIRKPVYNSPYTAIWVEEDIEWVQAIVRAIQMTVNTVQGLKQVESVSVLVEYLPEQGGPPAHVRVQDHLGAVPWGWIWSCVRDP